MPFPNPSGAVYIDSIRFSTNPAVYEPLNWKKRYQVFPAIGGKVTIQDFGVFMKDTTLRLGSGRENFLDTATVTALHSRWRTKGATYTLTDWLGDTFTVFIKDFIPIIFKPDLYTYSMELQVTAILQLWGATYTGA